MVDIDRAEGQVIINYKILMTDVKRIVLVEYHHVTML